jgi:hypothetical protein
MKRRYQKAEKWQGIILIKIDFYFSMLKDFP